MLEQDKSYLWGTSALSFALILFPFVYAHYVYNGLDPALQFGGLLFNPIDGSTYLAKIQAGRQGDWLFWLPYTVERGAGVLINTYYLALGHAARWLGLSNVGIFHLARVLGTLLMHWTLFGFFKAVLKRPVLYRRAHLLAVFGSGLGWLLLPTGAISSDFWVAEIYPFLSALSNAHFPLGLALIAWLLHPEPEALTGRAPTLRWIQTSLLATLLAFVSPFGVVVVLLALAAQIVALNWPALRGSWPSAQELMKQSEIGKGAAIAVGGGPVLLYAFFAIRSHPVLAGWDLQNLTPTPPWWDLAAALFPLLGLAIVGMRTNREAQRQAARGFAVWILFCVLMAVIPFNLQRRFLMGIFIPIAALASLGIDRLSQGGLVRARRLTGLSLALMVPTILILFWGVLSAVGRQDAAVYLQADEVAAFSWLDAHAGAQAIVLAAPQTGLRLPAYTNVSVIYGHPFESVPADALEEHVLAFYERGEHSELFSTWQIAYVFYGPNEAQLGPLPSDLDLAPVFSAGEVTILQPVGK